MKPWVPSTCAGDLRGLLMVALRSQGNWRWEGPLGTPLGLVHWKRASSPVEAGTAGYLWFQTPIAGSLQTGDRRVRPRLGLRHGTPLASRDVPGERGRLSSCIWNLGFFPNDARKNCPFVLTSFTGWSSERCPGIGFLSRGDREIRVLRNVEPPTRPRQIGCTEKLPLRVDFIHRVEFGEVSGHRVLIKRGPRNQGPTECGTTHEATSDRMHGKTAPSC